LGYRLIALVSHRVQILLRNLQTLALSAVCLFDGFAMQSCRPIYNSKRKGTNIEIYSNKYSYVKCVLGYAVCYVIDAYV